MTFLFFKCALSLYLLGSLGYILFIIFQLKPMARISYGLLFLGFLSHTLAIGFWYIQTGYFPIHNLGESLSLFAWAIIGMYLLIQLRFNILVLGSFLSPLAAVMMISSSFLHPQAGPANPLLRNLWLMVHVGTIFFGNGVFAIAFLAGIMYLIQERQIKSKHLGLFYHRLPSLEVLDSLNYNCLILGFPLLTLGMLSGAIFCPIYPGDFLEMGSQRGLVFDHLAYLCRLAARPFGDRLARPSFGHDLHNRVSGLDLFLSGNQFFG